uniref:Ig-like domain-containing protein n=1 Tax=Poecilia reticulata TaxID=8081 RepID=A0A3P9P0R6_POERE
MDLLWMVLLLVLVGSQAQKLVDVTGELGQDVTLTCSLNHTEVYWFMEVQNQTRTGIGPTGSSVPTYFSPDLENTKYSLSRNRLTVRNLSVDDGGMYFCERREDGGTVHGDPVRLIISGWFCRSDSAQEKSPDGFIKIITELCVGLSSLIFYLRLPSNSRTFHLHQALSYMSSSNCLSMMVNFNSLNLASVSLRNPPSPF